MSNRSRSRSSTVDPRLPLWDVVQDLYSTDPTQETCGRSCRLYVSHAATGAISYRPGIYLPSNVEIRGRRRTDGACLRETKTQLSSKCTKALPNRLSSKSTKTLPMRTAFLGPSAYLLGRLNSAGPHSAKLSKPNWNRLIKYCTYFRARFVHDNVFDVFTIVADFPEI